MEEYKYKNGKVRFLPSDVHFNSLPPSTFYLYDKDLSDNITKLGQKNLKCIIHEWQVNLRKTQRVIKIKKYLSV